MDNAELLKQTFARLEWSFSQAGQILNIPKGTIAQYATGRATVPPRVWLAILEYEARIYQRTKDIQNLAAATHTPQQPATEQSTPKRLRRIAKKQPNEPI